MSRRNQTLWLAALIYNFLRFWYSIIKYQRVFTECISNVATNKSSFPALTSTSLKFPLVVVLLQHESSGVAQSTTHTLAATVLLVCVFPVEGLVVFSTVGHSVAAGAGFVARTTTHATHFNSRDRQHALVQFRITGGFVVWSRKIIRKKSLSMRRSVSMLWMTQQTWFWATVDGNINSRRESVVQTQGKRDVAKARTWWRVEGVELILPGKLTSENWKEKTESVRKH